MRGNIIGEEIDKYVSDQIDFRQKIQGAGRNNIQGSLPRDANVLTFLNTRNTWVKLASGVGIENENEELKKAGLNRIKDIIKPEGYTTEQTVTVDGKTSNNIADTNIESLGGDELAKSYVLFNTTQKLNTDTSSQKTYTKRSGAITNSKWSDSFNKTYGGMGFRDQGLQPVPGITDVSIECVNRGSIKKAVVQLKAYNKFQFGIIELLYLRLGYTMLLEYGWDRYIDNITDDPQEITISEVGNTVIEQGWFDNPDPNPNTILTAIEAKRKAYKGNYDGFFGTVYNFEWNLNPDMTYDITINLMTVGSIITSLKAKPPSIYTQYDLDQLKIKLKAVETGETIESVEEDVDNTKENILSNIGNNEISTWLNEQKLDISPREMGHPIIDGFERKNISHRTKIFWPDLIETTTKTTTERTTNQHLGYTVNTLSEKEFKNLGAKYFIQLGWFLDVFFTKVNTYLVNTPSSTPIPQLEFLGEIDNLICNYVPNLIPLDPKICVFKPKFEEKTETDVFGDNSTYTKFYTNNLFNYVGEEKGVYYGKILNLYMNVDFLLDILDQNIDNNGDLSVFQYLKNLCDGINRSMAGITNLEPIIKNDKFVTIIEQNTPKGYDNIIPKKTGKKKSVDFELIGYTQDKSNFVKNFKFVTKITPDLGNIISIGAAAVGSNTKSIEALPFTKWNKGLKNIYQYEQQSNKPNLTKEEEEENQVNIKEHFIKNTTVTTTYPKTTGTYNFIWKYRGKTYTISQVINPDYGKDKNKYWDNTSLQEKVFDIVRKNIELEEISLELRQQNTANAYLTHLAKAFGGNSKEKTATTTNGIDNNITISTPIVDVKNARFWEINTDFIKTGISLFKRYISDKQKLDYKEKEVVSNSVGFIPLNLQMTVEGLSGVKIYNKLNIDQRFLPANYPDALSFITMKVNHSISNNYWDTNYECFSIPKSTKIPTDEVSTSSGTSIKLDNEPTPGAPRETVDGSSNKRFSVLKPNAHTGLLYETSEAPVKTQVVIHHTAGGGDIASVIKWWREKPEESCVSTQYIIGRDGSWEKLFKDDYWSQHLGTGIGGNDIEKRTIGIELISYGPLVKVGKGDEFKPPKLDIKKTEKKWGGVSRSVTIPRPTSYTEYQKPQFFAQSKNSYKEWSNWQSYTGPQLKRLKIILLDIFKKYPIINDIPVGSSSTPTGPIWNRSSVPDIIEVKGIGSYQKFKALELNKFNSFINKMFPLKNDKVMEKHIINNPGVYTHNSYRSGKSDAAPLQELITTLAVVGYEATLKTKSQGKQFGY